MSSPEKDSAYFGSAECKDVLARIDFDALPHHIAVIMDGNGRWATLRKKPRIFGHKAGAVMVKELIASCIELHIDYLTIYSFSSENWSRPKEEVFGLMGLFVEVLNREMDNLQERNVRVRVIGDLDELPQKTSEAFKNCVVSTQLNTGLTLIVAVNYGARNDIVSAVRAIAGRVQRGELNIGDISDATITGELSTAGIPDPDMIVRTSGEVRLSNFLLWEAAYSELVVTSVLWPDFDRVELLSCIEEYQLRHRRFGGVE